MCQFKNSNNLKSIKNSTFALLSLPHQTSSAAKCIHCYKPLWCFYTHTHTHTHTYIERERERNVHILFYCVNGILLCFILFFKFIYSLGIFPSQIF